MADVDVSAHNAVNSVYMVFTFAGQLFGTAVGNALYARGGWVWSGALNLAQVGVAVLLVLGRGPWEEGWVGWRGGWDLRRLDGGRGEAGDAAGDGGEGLKGEVGNNESLEKKENDGHAGRK